MARRRVSRDLNHFEIIGALRDCGVHVFDASHIGGGFPDVIASRNDQVYLLEIKNPDNWYGKRGLSASQERFSEAWRGIPIQVVRSVDEALRAVGVI